MVWAEKSGEGGGPPQLKIPEQLSKKIANLLEASPEEAERLLKGRRGYIVELEFPSSHERRKTGYAAFEYLKADDAAGWSKDKFNKVSYDVLRKNNAIKDGELIANIDAFYPFTDLSEKERLNLEGGGIGTSLLRKLLEEFKLKGADGVSCMTTIPKMKHLLEKAGFQPFEESVYFLSFKPGQGK